MDDSPDGLVTTVRDLDTNETGTMTASPANGFAHILFQPNATTCSEARYAFHPMFSTASEETRVVWLAHTVNVAFSDEIGHFEYCPNVADASIVNATGVCTSASSSDPAGKDGDDTGCFTADMSSRIPLSGCTGTDGDFDGPEYSNTWPGTNAMPGLDRLFHSTPIRFTSPLIRGQTNYDRIAYEADMPAIKSTCNGTTGAGCTNPPPGANFYPFYTAANPHGDLNADLRGVVDDGQSRMRDGCVWELGGRFVPGRKPGDFNNSTEEYGGILAVPFPNNRTAVSSLEDFRRVVSNNPCPAGESRD